LLADGYELVAADGSILYSCEEYPCRCADEIVVGLIMLEERAR
jgi:hypothetical protein